MNTDGTLDNGFNPGSGANGSVYSLTGQSDGKIFVGGSFSTYNGTNRSRVARVNIDGTLDTGFDPGSGASNLVFSSALQNNGKILIAGAFTSYNGTSRGSVARLNSDGSLDTSFDPGTGANNMIMSLALQSDGKVVVAGAFATYNGTNRTFIARANSNGSLDTTFDPGTGASNQVHSVAIQSDNKIILGGSFDSYNGTVRSRICST